CQRTLTVVAQDPSVLDSDGHVVIAVVSIPAEVLDSGPRGAKKTPSLRQERLINWGYAACDAAMRAHIDPGARRPAAFPFPEAGVGRRGSRERSRPGRARTRS